MFAISYKLKFLIALIGVIAIIFSNLSLSKFAIAQGESKPATGVISQTVAYQDFYDEIEALGTLFSKQSIALSSSVTETVEEVLFEDGQEVQKGQLLLKMEAAEEEAELAEAEATLNEAKAQLERVKSLSRKGVASKASLDKQERDYQNAKARVEAVRSNIKQRQITAPFDGVLGLKTRGINEGSLIEVGDIITTIDDLSNMQIDFSIPEIYLAQIEGGIKLKARSRAFRGEVFEGEVKTIDTRINPITRAILVRGQISNKNAKLKPGMLMRVSIEAEPRKALTIAEEAIIIEGDKHFVYVIKEEEGKYIAKKMQIKIASRKQGKAEVAEGLNEGDKIITHGVIKVADGAQVQIQE